MMFQVSGRFAKIFRICPHCGEDTIIRCHKEELIAYLQGAMVQDAFPHLAPEKREMIKTGIHPGCWPSLEPLI